MGGHSGFRGQKLAIFGQKWSKFGQILVKFLAVSRPLFGKKGDFWPKMAPFWGQFCQKPVSGAFLVFPFKKKGKIPKRRERRGFWKFLPLFDQKPRIFKNKK